MRKLIVGAMVAGALTVPATPAFAIHDATGMPGAVCSNPDSNAVGHGTDNNADHQPTTGVSNTDRGMAGHNPHVGGDAPPCTNA
jgi:hypothetical protein